MSAPTSIAPGSHSVPREGDHFAELATLPAPPSRAEASVLCCADRELSIRLLTRLPRARLAASSTDLLERVRRGEISLVIGDPSSDRERCFDALVHVRQHYPSALVAVYTRLNAAVVPRLLQLAEYGVRDVVIAYSDDTKSRFDELVERSVEGPLMDAIGRLLQDPLSRMPAGPSSSRDDDVRIAAFYTQCRRFGRSCPPHAAVSLPVRVGLRNSVATVAGDGRSTAPCDESAERASEDGVRRVSVVGLLEARNYCARSSRRLRDYVGANSATRMPFD